MTDLATNKKALFDYKILDKIEAGLMLTGQEVKAIRAGQMSLKGAFVTFFGNTPLLTNANISPYKFAGPLPDYIPAMSRRLLLKKKEIDYLRAKSLERGLTIVPIKVYTRNRFIKVEIAVGQGKHTYDKKEAIKNRDLDRELRRSLKE